MKTSFSPGTRTRLYYLVATPVTIVLCLLIFVGPSILGYQLAGLGSALSVIAMIALVWTMLSGGRLARAREQRAIQRSRDVAASSVATLNRQPARSPERSVMPHYVLYLRPFSSTGRIQILLKRRQHKGRPPGLRAPVRYSYTCEWGDLETTIAEAIEPVAQLVALGRPGEQIGAGRVLTADSEWKKEFTRLARGADQILVVPSNHPGTKWELDRLLSKPDLLRKTLIVLPPDYSYRRQALLPRDVAQNSKLGDVAHRSKFGLEDLSGDVSAILSDAIASLKLLGIDAPRKNKSGSLLRISADHRVAACRPLCIYSNSSLKIEEIRKAITDFH